MLPPVLSYSRTTINYVYSYDGSGNRVLREKVIRLKSAQLPKDSIALTSPESKVKDVFEEIFEKKQIAIYPNPTKGMITVEISLSDRDHARIALYDIKGELLFDYQNIVYITAINLSDKTSGTYVMKILINNKPTTWKIIKQK
jgi:hypothetical protein